MTVTHPTVTVSADFTTNLATGTAYHEQVLVSAPYAYHRLKETSGTFVDASGNGKTGTGAGSITYNQTTTPVTGDSTARNVNFTTDTTRIDFAGAIPSGNVLTVEAFVYVTDLSKSRFIFENDGTTLGKSIIEVWVATDGSIKALATDGAATVSTAAGQVVINTWYLVAVVFDGKAQQIRIYRNGGLVTTGTWRNSRSATASLAKMNLTWRWGCDSSASRGSIARLAEPAVYLRALSAAEFSDHFLALAETPFPGYNWTDITPYLLSSSGLRRTFGRSSELDDVVPFQTEFTLRNDDRRFEPENDGDTNLYDNPSFETDATGASNFSNFTLVREVNAALATQGSAYLKATTIGAVGSGGSELGFQSHDAPLIRVTDNTTYTFALDAWTPTASRSARLEITYFDSNFTDIASVVGSTVALGTTKATATRLSVTGLAPLGTVKCWVILTIMSAVGAGEIYRIDGVQLEAATAPTSYFDGGSADSEWAGTAHVSQSTRGGSPYAPFVVPGRPVRVQMVQNGVTYDWAFGFIEDWPQEWDAAGQFCRVPIRAQCYLARLTEEDIGARDFPEQSPSGRLTVLLNAAGQPTSMRDLDAGANTIMALVADTNTVGTHAKAVARTDRGLFFFDGRGYATYHDANHRTTDTRSTTPQGMLGTAVESGNLVTNPGLEVNTTGWSTYNTAVLTRVTSQFYAGVASGQVVTTADTQGVLHDVSGLIPGATYDFLLRVTGTSSEVVSTFFSSPPGTFLYSTNTTLTGAGNWLTVQAPLLADATGTARIQIQSASGAQTFYIDTATVLATAIPYSRPAFHAPKDMIRNEITLRRPGGVDQVVTNQTSRNQYGKRSYGDELLLTTDALTLARAAAILAAYKDPHLRVRAITFNPATSPGFWSYALVVQLADRYLWQFEPQQGDPVTRTVFVEGVTDDYTNRVYTSTWFLSTLS